MYCSVFEDMLVGSSVVTYKKRAPKLIRVLHYITQSEDAVHFMVEEQKQDCYVPLTISMS